MRIISNHMRKTGLPEGILEDTPFPSVDVANPNGLLARCPMNLANERGEPVSESSLNGSTFVTASAGNHGLSVARGAQIFGAKAVIYIADTVPEAFAIRLKDLGADVVREGANYEANSDRRPPDPYFPASRCGRNGRCSRRIFPQNLAQQPKDHSGRTRSRACPHRKHHCTKPNDHRRTRVQHGSPGLQNTLLHCPQRVGA